MATRQEKVLITNASASDATKVTFTLNEEDFEGSSYPSVKCRGLGTGDSVNIYELINGDWELGITLNEETKSTAIRAIGDYAVDVVVATGPVDVVLSTSREYRQ